MNLKASKGSKMHMEKTHSHSSSSLPFMKLGALLNNLIQQGKAYLFFLIHNTRSMITNDKIEITPSSL